MTADNPTDPATETSTEDATPAPSGEPPAAPPVALRALTAPKEGNSDEQYEDAYACSPPDGDPARYTVAVADGASSAAFAREWAGLLASTFAEGFPESDETAFATVAELGRQWRVEAEPRATTWWAQEKLPNGSSATLLVVTWDRENLLWYAASVGDVCAFLVRGNKLRFAFPVTRANKFSDRPALLTTHIGNGATPPLVVRYVEKYEPGDRFLLMTDALSQWFLAEYEARRKPWNDLPDSPDAFPAWLKSRRDSGALKNDDVTVVDVTL
jgi:serine/threonine protein phosphatase PrpC